MPNCIIEWIRLLAGIGNFVLASLALLLAVCVAVIRWKDVFRSDLRKRQFEELATVRRELHDVWFELYNLPYTRQMMESTGWNFDDLRDHAPDLWEGYRRYSDCSRSFFYKLQYLHYFLFPRWLDAKRLTAFKSTMAAFAPFTLMSSTTPDDAARREYADAIQAFIHYLDQQLQKHY